MKIKKIANPKIKNKQILKKVLIILIKENQKKE